MLVTVLSITAFVCLLWGVGSRNLLQRGAMALQAIETGKSVELCVDFVHVVGIRDHAAGDLGPPLRVKVVYVQDYPLVTCFFHF